VKGIFQLFFNEKKLLKVTKQYKSRLFLIFLLDAGRIRILQKHTDPDRQQCTRPIFFPVSLAQYKTWKGRATKAEQVVIRIRLVGSVSFWPLRFRRVQYARTDPRKYSFAVRTVESWNRLPHRVKTAETGESFKRRLRGKPE
jgi:hypothetical protein